MRTSDQAELIIGMMSGTSIDGIDVALVEFKDSTTLNLIQTELAPFSDQLRSAISNLAQNNSDLLSEKDSPLHDQLAKVYAQAALQILNTSGIEKHKISAIANHGQTVRHEPNACPAFSLQLGNGQLIANQTGIPTITQFRQADLAVGGQGAPLMPAFHSAFFAHDSDSFIINLGGIANLTSLNNEVIGFDTGPSNCLLDQWINLNLGKQFDRNGQWAASGKVVQPLLDKLMDDPYLSKAFPKSTGTDHYNLTWLESKISDLKSYEPANIQATLLAFTVKTIELALQQLAVSSGQIFICGGGAQNNFLVTELQRTLANFKIRKTDELGVPSDWVEAIGFAWLGYCYLHDIPSNLPSVTGASKHMILGEIYRPIEL